MRYSEHERHTLRIDTTFVNHARPEHSESSSPAISDGRHIRQHVTWTISDSRITFPFVHFSAHQLFNPTKRERLASIMEDGKNANPMILNPSDLPTRKRRTSNRHDTHFTSMFPEPSFSGHDLLYGASSPSSIEDSDSESDEPIDEQEVYDLISTMSDPEHPITLGSLAVVSLPDIAISPTIPSRPSSNLRTVTVLVTPTIQHCSLATVIGLGVRVRLEESLPARFRVDVRIKEGTHSTAEEVNKQLADKERVSAALWNPTLQSFIKKMMETCE
jgi:metal-sulfur cluster biosynthetic enzyme